MSISKLSTEEIYELLKKRIIHLEYEPGQVLNEIEVSDEFDISRTPIRKVFQLLQGDKLINIVPRFGAQVTPIDFKQMKYVFQVTRELDPFAARLTMDRIDPESLKELEGIIERFGTYDISKDYQNAINDDERFHQIIYACCGNPWLQDILTSLHYHTERLWHYSESYFDNIDLFSHTLTKVVEGLKEKDAEKVERYSRDHIDEFVLKIKSVML